MSGRPVEWVDAAPVREHVRRLLDAGLTKPQIGRRSGIAPNTITALMEGVHGRGPSLRVRRTTAGQLLAVEPELVGPEDGGWVDPIGTMRRLRSLVALGWLVKVLAQKSALPANTFWPILDERATVIRVGTRDRVISLYEQLTRQPAPPPSMGSTWARNRAARRAWPLPCVWSGNGIDAPDARPVDAHYPKATPGSQSFRVLIAPETVRQWAAVVEHMLDDDPGLSTAQVAARFDRAASTISAALRRAGRPDLRDRLAANGVRRQLHDDARRRVDQVEDLLVIEPDLTLAEARDRLGRDRLAEELAAAGRADLRGRLMRNTTRQKYRETR
ncbi:hypothetical protein [Microlunatus sp. Gsoil 973]|uniref:hypothetical protein n=1 Tax=Microlunatus sp. Gsoil 973 TaxID=2672569 RepID=UPI0012B50366|nr:hypothetical protein [Microlunatus sp. Gsoil 973]QGN33959.1 hypothetical protein GJV80_15305 [Microlunatus sp. Gsoil 973]